MDGGRRDRSYDEDRRAHFEALADTLRAHLLQKAHGYWEARPFQIGAHSDCVAISWSGGREYCAALAFKRDWTRTQGKLKTAEQMARRALDPQVRAEEREKVITACRRRYATKLDARYAHEIYVFYKNAEVVPDVLTRVAPGLANAFGRVPLHHYYIISRRQPAVDEGETPVFVDWTLEPETFPDQDTLSAALSERLFPEKCPMIRKTKPRPIAWGAIVWTLLSVIVGGALVAGAFFLLRSTWLSEMTERFDGVETELASIDQSLSALERRYAAMERDFGELLADGLADRADIEEILARLNELEALMHANGGAAAASAGLDHAPCALASSDPRRPAYLMRVQIGAQGLRIFEYPADPVTGAARRDAALATLDFTVDQPLDAAAFQAWAEPAYALSRQDDCRHFVILNETGQGAAQRYARLRAAVESRFYIYRPQP